MLERRKSALSSRNSELTPESAYADSEFRNVESNSEAEAADTEITSRSSESNIRGSDIGTTDQGSELENQGFKSENQDSESNIAGAADAMGAESGTSFESAVHEPMFRYRDIGLEPYDVESNFSVDTSDASRNTFFSSPGGKRPGITTAAIVTAVIVFSVLAVFITISLILRKRKNEGM